MTSLPFRWHDDDVMDHSLIYGEVRQDPRKRPNRLSVIRAPSSILAAVGRGVVRARRGSTRQNAVSKIRAPEGQVGKKGQRFELISAYIPFLGTRRRRHCLFRLKIRRFAPEATRNPRTKLPIRPRIFGRNSENSGPASTGAFGGP